MRKKIRKLRLNRETLRRLDAGLEHVVGGFETISCNTACPRGCESIKCEGSEDTYVICTGGVCSNECATGGACTVGC